MTDRTRPDSESSQPSSPQGPPGSRFEFGSCWDQTAAPPIAFGPVPSRRLGRSLGINNIPPKICSYSCLYCQVGPTIDRSIEPRVFYPPEQVAQEVAAQINQVQARGETIDYLTFVPDGEPSLDLGLGESIRLLKPLGVKVAVISNGTLLWRQDVRDALLTADWVSVKVDAATEPVWRRVNRPHPKLDFATVQEGIRRFVQDFGGDSVGETMLVDGVNDAPESVAGVGEFLRNTGIGKAYLAIPTRPTPYPAITVPSEESVNRAYQLLAEQVPQVEYLIGYEGDEFASSADPRRDLLSITAVHPMRASAVRELLARTDADWKIVEDLVADGSLTEVAYAGQQFYVRRFAS